MEPLGSWEGILETMGGKKKEVIPVFSIELKTVFNYQIKTLVLGTPNLGVHQALKPELFDRLLEHFNLPQNEKKTIKNHHGPIDLLLGQGKIFIFIYLKLVMIRLLLPIKLF